jgi:hypothetical protein
MKASLFPGRSHPSSPALAPNSFEEEVGLGRLCDTDSQGVHKKYFQQPAKQTAEYDFLFLFAGDVGFRFSAHGAVPSLQLDA